MHSKNISTMINILGFYYLSVFYTSDSEVEEIAHDYFIEAYISLEKGSRKGTKLRLSFAGLTNID